MIVPQSSPFAALSRGTARTMDLFSSIQSENPLEHSDAQAVKKDWETVGQDVREAITDYERQKPSTE